MPWTDITIATGLLIAATGAPLTIYESYRRWAPREQGRPSGAGRLEGIKELASRAACFGGVAMTQFGSVAGHLTEGTLPAHLWLSIVSLAAGVLTFGIALGRLHMRWQLSSLRTVPGTTNG